MVTMDCMLLLLLLLLPARDPGECGGMVGGTKTQCCPAVELLIRPSYDERTDCDEG